MTEGHGAAFVNDETVRCLATFVEQVEVRLHHRSAPLAVEQSDMVGDLVLLASPSSARTRTDRRLDHVHALDRRNHVARCDESRRSDRDALSSEVL